MHDMNALILDTETSGLVFNHVIPLAKQPEIIDLYMAEVDLAEGYLVADYEYLFKPDTWSEEAEHVHHITQDMVKDAPKFSQCADDIQTILERSDCVIAHNASFDCEMLDLEFERLGMKVEWPRIICTVEQTMHLKGYRLSLQDLHELLFGNKFKEAHRARTDTQALIRCCVELHRQGVLL